MNGTRLMFASGAVAPLGTALGTGQVLHGHSWGYLLIAAGLVLHEAVRTEGTVLHVTPLFKPGDYDDGDYGAGAAR